MKLVTRDTDYAVRALCYIAQEKPRIVPVSELVGELKIPRPFLRKILQVLHKKGVLEAYKGKGGGFILASTPGDILLVELMKIFQGSIELNKCLFKGRVCPNRNICALRRKIVNIEKRAISELEAISIASLI